MQSQPDNTNPKPNPNPNPNPNPKPNSPEKSSVPEVSTPIPVGPYGGKYDHKGNTSLLNVGNTCFANTCVQILSHTFELNELMDSVDSLNADPKVALHKNIEHEMMYEWNNLRKLMWSKNCTIRPNRFIATIHKVASTKNNDIFSEIGNQHDMTEFLMFIIDCFHTGISKPKQLEVDESACNGDKVSIKCLKMFSDTYSKEYSEIIELFYGIQMTILSTKDKTILNHVPEPFCSINLSLPQKLETDTTENPSLNDCFDYYTRSEFLTGDNKLFNSTTKQLEDAYTRIMFWGLPPILILDIKRFNTHLGFGGGTKRYVDFPINGLDMSKYVNGPDNKKYIYDLYGVCNHIGNNHGGHYFAFVKSSLGIWHIFNDGDIATLLPERIVSPCAYCLFYRIRPRD